tara:strand:+ start:6104 stop:6460 length:357 start_codon:yes stop_codon:yes gene_type:complete
LAIAVIFNGIGIINISNGDRALIGDTPEKALIACLPFAFVILAGFLRWDKVYRFLTPILLVSLAIGGFARHLIAAQSSEGMASYSSDLAWWSAVLINGYGTLVLAAGLYLAWKYRRIL